MKNNMNWNFDNSYSRLSNAFKEHIEPIAVKNPELVLINEDLAEELDLDFSKINKNQLSYNVDNYIEYTENYNEDTRGRGSDE